MMLSLKGSFYYHAWGMHAHSHTRTLIHTHTGTQMHTHIHALSHPRTLTCTLIHTHTGKCRCTYIHTHAHSLPCTVVHTHSGTHTLTHIQSHSHTHTEQSPPLVPHWNAGQWYHHWLLVRKSQGKGDSRWTGLGHASSVGHSPSTANLGRCGSHFFIAKNHFPTAAHSEMILLSFKRLLQLLSLQFVWGKKCYFGTNYLFLCHCYLMSYLSVYHILMEMVDSLRSKSDLII